ncbi:dynamin family protein [Domibacillus sp. A3M-37]|uniref:dynamin family protein n=1 Tax=Domibacillus sp. A3M-37 TaxID=2962037 RepID=UPI0020B66D6C|nr:dynamin family protein [Domibacillus sp. A3M-37]MCP3764578.1 dynamin family protein [Domibacillus sp. A3M-37]
MLDLKYFREQHLKMGMEEFVNVVAMDREQIVFFENNPDKITMEILFNLSQKLGIEMTELFQKKPVGLEVDDVYQNLKSQKKEIDNFIETKTEVIRHLPQSEQSYFSKYYNGVRLESAKPKVAILGPSDAGKSTMINSLMGREVLLSQWTPTTSATVYLKHISDKPAWMGVDEVWVFKADSTSQGWEPDRYDDKEYCFNHKLDGGSIDILREYTNRESLKKYPNVDSAVVYLDASILKACDIIDLPGFGTDTQKDTLLAQRAIGKADAVVFLCQSNAFFNKEDDLIFIKTVIQQLGRIDYIKEAPLLSNIFVVASQAKAVGGKSSLSNIYERGYTGIANQLSEEVIKSNFNLSKQDFLTYLKPRFFSYATEEESLRLEFEQSLLNLLEKVFPKQKDFMFQQAVDQFQEQVVGMFKSKEQVYIDTRDNRKETEAQYQRLYEGKESFFKSNQREKERLSQIIDLYIREDRAKIKSWEDQSVTIDRVIRLIEEKRYSQEQAKKLLASNVSDLYYAKLTEVLKDSLSRFKPEAEKFYEKLQTNLEDLSKIERGHSKLPFDIKGSIAGGLASAGVLGGLGAAAATMGNLGGYILLAKGVSILSALGISVGGTATAASFVAAIGGPITIGIALAAGVFFLVKKLFGNWKKDLAELVLKQFQKDKVLESYQRKINDFWNGTQKELDSVISTVEKDYLNHLTELKQTLDMTNPEEIEAKIYLYKELQNFVKAIPRRDQQHVITGAI